MLFNKDNFVGLLIDIHRGSYFEDNNKTRTGTWQINLDQQKKGNIFFYKKDKITLTAFKRIKYN